MTDRIDWSVLEDALAESVRSGTVPVFWWRDDDAVEVTAALERLLSLVERYGTGLLVASIPSGASAGLAARLRPIPGLSVAVHGISHRNNAPADRKKQELGEFGDEDEIIRDLEQGLVRMRSRRLFGDQCLPVLVPPWNRISQTIAERLPEAGYRGLSCYGDESRSPWVKGLRIANTQVDPIFWRGGGGLLPPEQLLEALSDTIRRRSGQPIGLLTHHLVHDEAIWSFLEGFCERVSRVGARWIAPENLFFGGPS